MTVNEVMDELRSMGADSIKKILLKHGVKEPFFGVKVEHLKVIQKRVKINYELAKGLFLTGNADAMYLAGLIADDAKMTREDLATWADMAESNNISEYTVPWVAAGSRYGLDLALEWIGSDKEHIAAAGWCTLSSLMALKADADLDIALLKSLLARVEKHIAHAKNRERHTMNGFIIAAGTYVKALADDATATAGRIGVVTVDMNGTACKVPDAVASIAKAAEKGVTGKKKKTVKC